MCFIVTGDTYPALSYHGTEGQSPRWGHDGQRQAQAGQGGDGRDGQPPRPAGQVPGRWGCERRLMEVRWPDGWECPRCSHQFSVTVGTATRHSKARLRRWSCAMWPLARSGCLRRAVGQGRGERPPPHRARQERLGGPITCTYEVCWEALAKFIGAQEMAKSSANGSQT